MSHHHHSAKAEVPPSPTLASTPSRHSLRTAKTRTEKDPAMLKGSAPLRHTLSAVSQRTQPDLAFPYLTQETSIGVPNAYHAETSQGYIATGDVESGLNPVLSCTTRHSMTPTLERELTRLEDKKIVTWFEADPENPWNWGVLRRWIYTAIVACAVMQVALSSAIVTGDFPDQMEHFHVGETVIALTVTLPVCGFGLGPLLWSPLSELFGRKPLWVFPTLVYIIFNIPCALAPNIGCLLASRFLCGFFGSAPLTLAGGTIADIWSPEDRGFAIAIFAAAP